MLAITHAWADWLVAALLLLGVVWALQLPAGIAAVIVALRGRGDRAVPPQRPGHRPFRNPWSELDNERLSNEYAAQRDALARAVRGR